MSESLSRRLKRLWWRMRRHRVMARDLPAAGRRAWVYARLMRFDRPIGNFLLLWPMLWGLWLAADGHPNPRVFVVFVLGVLIMRACGCVINDFADRRVDPHVKRTTQRPMATGEVTSRESLTIFVLLGLTAFVLVLFTNALTLKLAFAGIALAAVYPFMKRYTYLPQAWLGIAFGWAVPMAYAAQLGTVPPEAWLVYIAVILWTVIFDTQYAMVDRDDDVRIGVKSTAILFGDQDRLILGLLQITLMVTLLLVGVQYQLNPGYYWALAFASLFFVYQQKLTWHRQREDCFRAFLNNNWFGGAVFAGIVLHYAFEPYLS